MRERSLAEEKLGEMLREAGCRVTAQRLLLLRLLHDSKGHAGADDLYRLARAHDRRLNLSTVYRTLNKLREVGLVHELDLDGEHHHFELAGRDSHHHLICEQCGKIIEIKCFLVDEVLGHIEQEHGFRATNTQMEFRGYCADCWTRLQSA